MFPNPQDSLPLPPNPNLEQYKKLAKDLLKAAKSADGTGIESWTRHWIEDLARRSGIEFTPELPAAIDHWTKQVAGFAHKRLGDSAALADAQYVIARSHGFASWPKFAQTVEHLTQDDETARFEAAADAVVTGDIATLERLLREHPELVYARSSREHHATLLHYCAANGVEGYRQKTPQNIVAITKLLLDAGAEVDAAADVYGGGSTTLGLAATSCHPEAAGVQELLMQLLLDYGASLDHNRGGNKYPVVKACLMNGRGRAARFLAERGAPLDLDTAAGAGMLDSVKNYFDAGGTLKPPATQQQLQRGCTWAATYGFEEIVRFLLDHGADFGDPADLNGTALHWATGGAHINIVQLLLDRGAPLEVRNAWGGTVLEHAGWALVNGERTADYAPIFAALLAAGAKINDG